MCMKIEGTSFILMYIKRYLIFCVKYTTFMQKGVSGIKDGNIP